VQAPPSLRIRVGVDIVGVERVTRLLSDDDAILDKMLTEGERDYCAGKRQQYAHVAARFAAKEAVLKAFGTGIARRMAWTDVEIVKGRGGRPEVRLHGEVAAWAARRGLADVDVSLSHSAGLAVAQAIAVWHDDEVGSTTRERPSAIPSD
jgi:holo-[acyl-carrier protein] synthase